MPLPVGTKAPDFTLLSKTADGIHPVRLSDNFGSKNTVLIFFPAAFSTTCTSEMCDVSNGLNEFAAFNADVYGISVDSAYAQHAWAQMEGIRPKLLSDYKHEVTRAYDVELPDLSGLGPSAARAVFLIDKDGIIRYTEQTPTPGDLPDFNALRQALSALP